MKETLSPASLLVLGCTFLLSSPALWDAFAGELSLHAAMTRYLIVLVACWFVLSIAASLAPRPLGQQADPGPEADPAGAGASAGAGGVGRAADPN